MDSNYKTDWWLLAFMTGLLLYGFLAIFSATTAVGSIELFYRQLAWGGIGLFVIAGVYYLDPMWIKDKVYILYVAGLLLLLVTLVVGVKVAGATSWIRIGFISVQPSEFAKITTILALCRYLSSDSTDITQIQHVLIAMLIVLLPAGLVMLQPDMGTVLTYLSFLFPVMVMAGFNAYYLLLLALPLVLGVTGFFSMWVLAGAAVAGFVSLVVLGKGFRGMQVVVTALGVTGGLLTMRFAEQLLQPHQLKRIQTFLDPMLDPRGAGYNALQAKIAIGSGGVFGKGYLEGTQTQLRFIPAQWTDFIFCVIGEEMGFAGSALLLLLFMAMLLRLLWMASMIKNQFVELVLVGFVSLFLAHLVINVGMTIGLFPVVGVPLPFLSYGGTALIANMVMIGIALNFYRNKRDLGY
ncbi:rod shape-determining protein RodA [Prosthecochloris vibrioformis]|uniref:Peptidoglycan glycosyltransferase RodA n=1 Tax=Prosthecochloris vibrioformis TaxID=1098 RepID=A0A5C4S462_PROVB|nr:rod shape-determining protein RodA [Prosthecochloris vibrioformis]TNJ37998.1 rod shape-determining protein RodA [Prosthecochloris vibrioformis]